MQERHLDFLAIFESASKFTELLHGTFDLLDKHCSVFFSLVCALFLRNKVCKKMRQCALNFLVKTGNKRNRSSSLLLLVGFFLLRTKCAVMQCREPPKVMTLQCFELTRITFKLCLLTCILERHAFLIRRRPSDSKS